MSSEHPLAARYLRVFSVALERGRVAERDDIVREIGSHIAEAQAAGRPVEEVLKALGSPETLARAYAVDSAMTKNSGVGRALAVIGILIASGIVTMIVAIALGSVGFAFTLSGVLLLIVGAAEQAGVHWPFVQMGGLPPVAVILLSPVFFAVGIAALWALWRYFHALARTLRRALPTRSAV